MRKGDVAAHKEPIARAFRMLGWEADELARLMMDVDDFYWEHLGVVRLPSWPSGHAVLVGDAAHCAPKTWLGRHLRHGRRILYVLAGEIERHSGRFGTRDGLSVALKAYDDKFRPFMAQVQKGKSSEERYVSTLWGWFMGSHLGIRIIDYVVSVVAFPRLDCPLVSQVPATVTGCELPDYSEIFDKSTI